MITKKESGIKWIGKIPINWSTGRLKNSVLDSRNGLWGEEAKGNKLDYYCIRVADFDRDSLVVKNKQFTVRNVDTPDINSVLLKKGDLLIEKSGGGEKQPVGAVVQYTQSHPAIYANFIAKLAVNKRVASPHYLRYLHGTIYNQGLTRRSIKQTTGIQNLDLKSYLNEVVIYPPLPEQLTIADFLDQKTSEIDTLIADKEKLIKLLEEKRQAIITEAVTKGLNPDVKMKDSSVEWIGEIPEHWSCYRLKTLITKVQGGAWGKDQQNNENDIPCVRIADFDRTNAKLKKNQLTVRNLERQEKLNHLINQGDLLIEKSGGGEKQPVGYAVIFSGESPTVYTNFIAKLSPNKDLTIPDYLKNIFQVLYFYRLNTKSIKQTTGIQNLDLTSYLNEKVMVPSLKEQEEIKNHIIQLNEQTNDLINTLKETIYKLKEYRQSLIYEAVTGKINVQEMVKETEQEEVSSS